jgi:hypothetical protein
MANENQTTNDSFWDRVEGATNTSASTASADKPTNSADPGQSVAHGFWDRVEGKKTSMGTDVVNIGGQPVNLKTGVGAQQASVSQAQDETANTVKSPQGHVTSNPATPSPMARGGYGMPGNVLPDIGTPERAAGTKMATTMGAAAAAPAVLPEMAGSGFLSYMGRLLARAGLSGAGAGVGNSAGQTITGDNPLSTDSLKESGKIAATQAILSLPFEAVGGLPNTKLGRSMINQSLGAQTRDITYGNPAKALIDEGIHDVATGDFEAYKDALRSGKTPAEASKAAGGRFASVNQRIEEYGPRLEKVLSQSQKTIPVADAIDAPLHKAAFEIIGNSAMTDAEKDAALTQLGAFQKSLKEGLGKDVSPLQLNKIKQSLGNRMNWGGTISVTDDIKPALRSVYGTMNKLISDAVPEAKELNERLSNLYAAQSDLETLTKAEEVGRGGGVTGGKIGSTLVGKAEREVGRVLPVVSAAAKSPVVKAATAAADSAEWVRVQDSNGSQWDVHPSDLRRMQSADPGVQLLAPN